MELKDTIVNEFNEFSKNYTNDMIGFVPHYLDLVEAFALYLPEGFKPKKILDLGCGNGNVTSRLLQLFPDADYTLLDASQEMLTLCRESFRSSSMTYIESYFKDYNFKEGQFDMVIAGFSLHHCNSDEKQDLFKKIHKTLTFGGLFACSDLMINKEKPEHTALLEHWRAFVFGNFSSHEKWKWLMEHYDEFDKPDDYNDQIAWLKAAGFKKTGIPAKYDYWVHLQAFKL
jgi:ubiquinone/menaquinone biosynthesis C-methylase UbiE